MGVAQSHVNFLTLDFGPIADAVDIQHTVKSLTHPLGHVRDELSSEAMQRADLAIIELAFDAHDIAVDSNFHARGNRRLQFSFRPLQANTTWVDRDLDACGKGYR